MAEADDAPREEKSSSPRKRFEKYRERFLESTPWIGQVKTKIDLASPYNLFLTRITDSRNTYDEDLTISFPELLDSSFGELEHSLHINYMIELDWLLAQYVVTGHQNPSMTLIYNAIDQAIPRHLNIKGVSVLSPYLYGHHHTKMSIFFYKDKSLRIAIYTANLIESDWENRTQGVWVSPHCPYLGDDVPINYGESDTLFKHDILKYLNAYCLGDLRSSILRIQDANLSEIKVFLIVSFPGSAHQSTHGYKRVQKLLLDHVPEEYCNWDLVVQCSSIGSLGSDPRYWLHRQFVRNLNSKDSVRRLCDLKLIYPTVKNVKESHDGLRGAGCLPYRSSTHRNQLWLGDYLCQWKSDHRHRTRALPHLKTYAKLSPDGDKLAWFLLTSANLSKAAWGKTSAAGRITIFSYEVGVLFLPRFLIGKDYFNVKIGGNMGEENELFPIPYDVPLTPYKKKDRMFLHDKNYDP